MKKLIGWGIALGVLAAVHFMWTTALRAELVSSLSAACQRPVTIRAVGFVLPLGIRVADLEVPPAGSEQGPLLRAEEIRIQILMGQAVQGRVSLSVELIQPELSVRWSRQTGELLALGGARVSGTTPAPIQRVRIRRGRLQLLDEQAVPPTPWRFQDLEADVRLGGAVLSSYELDAAIGRADGGEIGRLESQGSFIPDGPFEAKVSFRHDRMKELAPYLREVLGPTPVQGSLELDSRITVFRGVLMAHNQVSASDVRFATEEPTTLGPSGNRLVELLSDREGKVQLGFVVNGRLGQRLDWSDLAAAAMQTSLQQAMARGIQRVLGETEQQPLADRLQKGIESIER